MHIEISLYWQIFVFVIFFKQRESFTYLSYSRTEEFHLMHPYRLQNAFTPLYK